VDPVQTFKYSEIIKFRTDEVTSPQTKETASSFSWALIGQNKQVHYRSEFRGTRLQGGKTEGINATAHEKCGILLGDVAAAAD